MSNDDIGLMRTFVRAAEVGSFTRVAADYGITQATVSRQINALETSLGVRLFQRTTRSMYLTDEGRTYLQHALNILDAIEQASAAVKPDRNRVRGTLRIAGPLAFTRLQVLVRMHRFLDKYPAVNLDFVLNDRPVDLISEGIDVAIRIGEITDESLIVRRVGETRRVTVARRGYFKERAKPHTPADLVHHDCIVFSGLATNNDWYFKNPRTGLDEKVTVGGRVRVNASESVRQAVLNGFGIAVAPIWLFDTDITEGRVEPILESYAPTPLPIQIVYSDRRMVTPRLRAFIDFIAEEFRGDPLIAGRGVRSAAIAPVD